MKFIVETKALQEALAQVGVGTAHRSTLPILSNVLLHAAPTNELWLSTTDLYLWVRVKVSAMVAKEGAVTVPFAHFSRLVARITASKITVTLNKNTVDLSAGDVKAGFETVPAEEFPPAPVSSGEEVTCDAAEILVPFQKVKHAICTPDKGRYVLEGINIRPGDSEFLSMFTATNGTRLTQFVSKKFSKDDLIVSTR